MTDVTRSARTFTLWTAAALTLQAAGGLLVPGLYRDNIWIVSTYRATDLNALVLDVPLLLAAMTMARRGSVRARLVWLGTIYYVFYNNLYFLIGTAFNRFFLVYVAVAVSSAFALAAALAGTDADALAASAGARPPRRIVVILLVACASVLGSMWVGQSLAYIATGALPQIVLDAGTATSPHVIAALDLTAIVPLLVLGAAWLHKRRPWGYVVSAGMAVQVARAAVSPRATRS